MNNKILNKTSRRIFFLVVCVWQRRCLCAKQVGHLQRSEGVCLWETSQRHGVPLLLPESGWLRRGAWRQRRRSVDPNTHTHDLIHSHTPPTALRTLHQWQSCKYISQMTYKHCSINWCKCKKTNNKWWFDVSFFTLVWVLALIQNFVYRSGLNVLDILADSSWGFLPFGESVDCMSL